MIIICPRCGKLFKEGTGKPVIVNDRKAKRSYFGELCLTCDDETTPQWLKDMHKESEKYRRKEN